MSIHVHLLQEEDDTEADQIYVNEDGGDRTHISRSDSNLNISDDGSLDDDQDQDQDRAARQFRDPTTEREECPTLSTKARRILPLLLCRHLLMHPFRPHLRLPVKYLLSPE